jgi:DNA-binding NarL/FixJ family response regulator
MHTEHKQRPVIRIGLLESEPIRVEGLRAILEGKAHIQFVVSDILELLDDESISIILLGLHNVVDAFDIMASIKEARPQLRMIVMGPEVNDETIINVIAAGAKGYLEETALPEHVEQAIEVVHGGSIWAPRRVLSLFVDRALHSSSSRALRRNNSQFTDREREVLKLLVAARSNREIAEILGIEERTVKAHVARLMRKVGVDNRIALSVHAVTHDLVDDDEADSA